jgi:hypothetical protein
MRETSRSWIRFWKSEHLFEADLDDDLVATLICGAYNELSKKMLASAKKPDLRTWLLAAQAMVVRGFGTPKLIHALDSKRHGDAAQ